MCGIAGVIDYRGRLGPEPTRAIGLGMREAVAHRGPDDAGVWLSHDGRACLVHRRLAIIDPRPEGRQPMMTPDGSVALTYNGELYNYRVLRARLAEPPQTQTDTEVLLGLLATDDPHAVLAELRGTYGLAAWYERRHELLLARNPFGKKPLYYVDTGEL